MASIPRFATGFAGLGSMGWPICSRIIRTGSPTYLFDLDIDIAEHRARAASAELDSEHITANSMVKPGRVTAVGSVEALAAADVLMTCLPNSRAVHDLFSSIRGHLTPGMLWLDLTSGDPAASRELSSLCSDHGVEFLDVAVSGGPGGASRGELTAMIGGDPATFQNEKTQLLLGSFANNIVHIGPSGSGHAVKVCIGSILCIPRPTPAPYQIVRVGPLGSQGMHREYAGHATPLRQHPLHPHDAHVRIVSKRRRADDGSSSYD